MAKRKSSSGNGCLSSVIGVVAVTGVLGGIITFVDENKKTLLLIVGGIFAAIILVAIIKSLQNKNEMDENLARYKPTTLLAYYQLSENERNLMMRALLFLREGIFCFTPHDVGVAGDAVSSNYYTTMINKGYLDRPKRGYYSINKTHLSNALSRYYDIVQKKIENTKQVKQNNHLELAAHSRETYMNDLSVIRLFLEETISIDQLDYYLEHYE